MHHNIQLHQTIVHAVLQHFEDQSFFLKATKCHFEQTCINYLGIVVEDGKITLNPVKQWGLLEWPIEQSTITGVCSTLGVFGYHRPFIPGFAKVAHLLTDLLKKNAKFTWGDAQRNTVTMLIKLVEQDMALNQPDHEWPFKLEVNVSQFAISAILFQCTLDGLPYPISYYSHTLSSMERGYNVHDWELLSSSDSNTGNTSCWEQNTQSKYIQTTRTYSTTKAHVTLIVESPITSPSSWNSSSN